MGDERFIPFLRGEVDAACVEACAEDEREKAREMHRLLAGVVHQRYRPRLRAVEQDYFLLHPPEYAAGRGRPPLAERERARRRLEAELTTLALTAGYTRVSEAELEDALHSQALLRVRMELDRDAIAGSLLFRRGETTATAEVPAWFGLRRKTIEYVRYSRMLVYVTFRDDDGGDAGPDGGGGGVGDHGTGGGGRSAGGGRRRWADRHPWASGLWRVLTGGDTRIDPRTAEPGTTVMKLFSDVPRDDMEMLFPGVQPRMRLIDKLLIAIPALISGVVLVSTKLISALGLLVLMLGFWMGLRDTPVEVNKAAVVTVGVGMIALGSYLMRQYRKFTRRQLQFMNSVAESLYYRNLDNNAGVFYRLIGAAEDAEFKQSLLAYHHLRWSPEPLGEAELSERVEAWPALRHGRDFRFDVAGATQVLRDSGVMRRDDGGRMSVAGLDDTVGLLRRVWCDSAG